MESNTTNLERIELDRITDFYYERTSTEDPDALEELAWSMSRRQEDPITVRDDPDGDLQLVTGYRRYHAAEKFGDEYDLDSLKAELADLSDLEAARSRVAEEVHREDQKPIDVAEMVREVYEEKGTQPDTAEWFSKSVSWVSKKLSLLDMDEEVQEAVNEGDISENAASAVDGMDDKANRERVVTEAKQENLTEDEVKERINEVQEEDTHVTEVANALERIREKRESFEEHTGKAERFEEVKDEIDDLDDQINAIWEEAPKQASDRYEQYQNDLDRQKALERALDLLEQKQDHLREEADEIALSDSEQEQLTSYNRELTSLRDDIGHPTVTKKETSDSNVHVSIDVTVDPDDMPSLVEEFLDKAEQESEIADKAQTLEDRKKTSATIEKNVQDLPNNVGKYLDFVDDPTSLDANIREVFKEFDGQTRSDIENQLEAVEEAIEETDEEELEALMDELDEKSDEAEDLMVQKKQLEKERKRLKSAPGNASNAKNAITSARGKAVDHFEQMDNDTAEDKFEQWSEVYDFDLSFLTGDEAEADTDDQLEVEDGGGGWYEVTDGDETVKVQGEEAKEEVIETWATNGVEAAQAVAE